MGKRGISTHTPTLCCTQQKRKQIVFSGSKYHVLKIILFHRPFSLNGAQGYPLYKDRKKVFGTKNVYHYYYLDIHINILCINVLYWTLLYCSVLYCTALYCSVLYCTALYCTIVFYNALRCIVL